MEILRTDNIEAFGMTGIGRVRKANEDSMGWKSLPYGELFVVCDGMGGHKGGATASRIAVDTIISSFSLSSENDDPSDRLRIAVTEANDAIILRAGRFPELEGMGTTACVVLVKGSMAYLAHVGDSRIYLYDGADGRLHRVTKDHSLVQSLVDCGEIDEKDAEHHPQKNIILRALGIREEVRPTIAGPIPVGEGDKFLICSDGLSGMVDDDTMEAIIKANSPQKATERLFEVANMPDRGRDNITVELIHITFGEIPSDRQYRLYDPSWRR